MKKVFVLAMVFVLAATSAFAAPEVTLRYGNGAALGAAGDLWGAAFCKYVAELSAGKMEVEYYNNSQLGVDSEMQTQMQNGDLDIVSCQPGQTTTFVPAVAIYDLPLVFARYDAATIQRALTASKFADMLNEKYAERNMICLGVLQGATYRVMTSNKEIKTIDDFAGIKIRTMSSPNHLAFWNALGANPTPLAFTELYMSLQNGTVDAQENANDTNVSSNFNEVQKYLVNVRQLLYANQFLMNKETYDGLAPEYQLVIKEALKKATDDIAPTLGKIDSDNRDKLVKAGMKDLTFDNDFYSKVIEKAQPVYAEVRKQIGDALVDALLAALEGK